MTGAGNRLRPHHRLRTGADFRRVFKQGVRLDGPLFLLVAAAPVKTVDVNMASTAPRIDGRIEAVWLQADSTDDFVQSWPDEGAAATERTVVRVLQDDGNLYVAFRCYAAKHRPVAALYGLEEAEGVRALILELVEGPTLAERLAAGPFPFNETIRTRLRTTPWGTVRAASTGQSGPGEAGGHPVSRLDFD